MTTEQTLNMDNINLEGEIETSGSKVNLANGSSKMTQRSDTNVGLGMFSASMDSLKPQEWISKRRETLKPWTEFGNYGKFKKPDSVGQCGSRLIKNIAYFQSNYLFVLAFLAIYCILTSPLLLFAFAGFSGGLYMVHLKNKNGVIQVMGKDIGVAQLYSTIILCSIPLFLLVGAGSAVFWIIGASIVVVALHASFYDREEQDDPFMAPMNVV